MSIFSRVADQIRRRPAMLTDFLPPYGRPNEARMTIAHAALSTIEQYIIPGAWVWLACWSVLFSLANVPRRKLCGPSTIE